MPMKTRPPSSRRPPKKEFGSPRQVAVLVGLHPCLWDPQHPNYKITTAQDAAWDAISKRLNNTLSAEECKEQWFCIRRMKTNYNNEQVKKSGSGRRKVRGFTYAKETTFIDGILKKRELQEGNLGTSKGLALDLSDNEDDEAGDEDEFDLEEEDVDDDDDDEVDDDEEEEEEDDDVKQSAMDYSAEMAELTRLKREQQHLKITMNSPSKPVLSEINDNSLKSLKEIPEVKTVNPLGKGRKGTENAKAGKKKVVLVTSKKAFSKRSQGLEDEDLFSDYENIGPKKKTKLQLKQEKQEQREKKREKDRLIIAKKIQEQCDEYIPDRKQTSHFDMKPSTDGMVMHSFMPQQEEDSMNLVCLALASRLRKLPNREANKITIHFMQTVNDAEDKLELEPISKPTVSDAEDKIELEPIRKPNQNFEKVFQYPKVDKDMEVTINLGFQVDDDDIVCQYSCYIIRGQDFVTLKNGSWVNDQIIDMYLRMLSDYAQSKQVRSYTCHFISSLLAHGTNGLKENNRTEIPIESYDYLLIPRCIDHHWYLIVVDVKMKSITCYDSLGKKHFGTLELIKIYLSELSNGEWSTEHAENIPMQNNGSDCGIFLCLYAKCLSLDKEFEFSQAGIPQLRKIVAYEVMTTTVLV